ncbi:hypothetical protein AGMMS50229_18640 [Campylobacterota bacterium]|nr:hypothetical protein AGMMS50229_18640 [Campylobacterota bacterium]
MDDFDKLKQININDIHKKTHISITELRLILAKDFGAFNRTKALGFIKIFEREYGFSLDAFAAECRLFYDGLDGESDQIFVIAKEEKGSVGKWIIILIVILAGILAAIFVEFSREQNSVVEPAAPLQLPMVSEAQAVVGNRPANEEIFSAAQGSETIALSAERMPFFVTTDRDLWIGIYYADSDRREQITINKQHEFDSTRPQVVTFGHGMFRLTYGERVIEPKSGFVQRFSFRDGDVTALPTASQVRRDGSVVEQ